MLAHVEADDQLPGGEDVEKRPQGAYLGESLGADDHARGSGAQEPRRGLFVAHARVHPRLRSQTAGELTDGLEMVSPAGDRVEVGDVHRLSAALATQRPRYGHGIAAGDEPAAYVKIGVPLTAEALHDATPHEV